MKVALIISAYNRPEALELVLKSIEIQTLIPDEVVIADDGSNNETIKFIESYISSSKLNIIHSYQKDEGFRVSRSRNKAVSKSSSEYLIFIDADMILDKNFVYDHYVSKESNCFVQGSRVLIGLNKTLDSIEAKNIKFGFFSFGISNRHNAIRIPGGFFSRIHSTKLRGIRTCNFSLPRKLFYSVNGFNNEIEGWGREDTELVVRLYNKGFKRKNIKFAAIQFHLYHEKSQRLLLEHNEKVLKRTIDERLDYCSDGVGRFK